MQGPQPGRHAHFSICTPTFFRNARKHHISSAENHFAKPTQPAQPSVVRYGYTATAQPPSVNDFAALPRWSPSDSLDLKIIIYITLLHFALHSASPNHASAPVLALCHSESVSEFFADCVALTLETHLEQLHSHIHH